MRTRTSGWYATLACLGVTLLPAAGCGDGGASSSEDAASASDSISGTDTAGEDAGSDTQADGGMDSAGEGTETTDPTQGEEDSGGVKFDVEGEAMDMGTIGPICKVIEDMDAIGNCEQKAPPDAFEPEVQWGFAGENGNTQSITTALVANLTDDNDDGEIDLCDIPDVVVGAFAQYGNWNGPIYAINGETGELEWTSEIPAYNYATPAIGDIDGDGLPEIVSMNQQRNLLAFEHDGSLKWTSPVATGGGLPGAIGIADFDNDTIPEIYVGGQIFDDQGNLLVNTNVNASYSAPTASDIDDDGDLEFILGHQAFHHDGSVAYISNIGAGFPQVADLDEDGEPEVLVTNNTGLSLIEVDGTIIYTGLTPTGDNAGGLTWLRPATVHDFDGDEVSEFAVSSRDHYALYEGDATLVWQADVTDASGIAAGTAFDFLGDGGAEAMYADENFLFVFDDNGDTLLSVPRSSGTLIEYPIVADVDNDGSAEIVVTSNVSYVNNQTAPLVQVVRDVDDRWIQARRIWNQHTYHVTNVREDGTIPQFEAHHWETLNTFRTNAQIEGGGICVPEG